MAMQMHLGERARASVSCYERGHQRQSESIRGHQRQWTVSCNERGHQRQSDGRNCQTNTAPHDERCNQRQSEAIRWTKLTLANALASAPACPS
jgi:hypothetical protein